MKWISWFQPTEDHRPIKFPPTEKVLGWWCTGDSSKGQTLVALVDAESEEEAKSHILLNWPEVVDWRFCAERDTKTFNSRFPLQEWMIERGLTQA